MTYEDAIRVAQLKTRPSRLERIRSDARDPAGEIVVTDYLKPDLDEIYGILPHRLVAPFARWAERRWPDGRSTPGQHVRTTTISGYLRLWLLARCRFLRPASHRRHHEQARMERWLRAIERCAARDAGLAREVAEAAQLVKGYGRIRRRLESLFDDLIGRVLRAVDLEAAAGGHFEVARALARWYRTQVLQGPEGEARAPGVAGRVIERLEAGDRAGALAGLS
jgi:indolepyruvate ferredoxin oxidoreductase beta subunit